MNSFVGNKKQEEKIEDMGEIAHTLFPEISKMNFKGSFRYGIEASLKMNGINHWSEVAKEKPSVRKQFFIDILDNSISKLKSVGLSDNQVKTLFHRLKVENSKYLD